MNIKNLITAFLMLSGVATFASASTINELEVNGSPSNNDTLASAQMAASNGAPNSSATGYQASPSVGTGKGNGDNSSFFVKGGKDYFDIDGAMANFYRLLGLFKPNAKVVVPPKDSASAKADDGTSTESSQETSDSSVSSDATGVTTASSLSNGATLSGATTTISASSSSAYYISPIQTASLSVLTTSASPAQTAPAKIPLPSSFLLFGLGAVTLLLVKSGSKKAINM